MYVRVLNFRSDKLRMKRTKFGPHEYFPLYGIASSAERERLA